MSIKNNIGRCQSVAVDPTDDDIVYLGSMSGGLWKSINATVDAEDVQWVCLTDNYSGIGAFDIAIDPDNHDTVFIIVSFYSNCISNNRTYSAGVLKTIDGGINWEWSLEIDPASEIMLTRIVYDPSDSDIMYILADKGFYKSIDGGDIWSNFNPISGANQLWEIVIDPSDGDNIYVCGKNDLYFSDDGGDNFTDVKEDAIGANNSEFIVIDYNPDDGYTYGLFKGYGLYKSINGTDWANVSSYDDYVASYVAEIDIAPDGGIYAGGILMKYSNDGGFNFSTFPLGPSGEVHYDTRDVAFSNSASGVPVFIATDGGICRSTTGGNQNWESINGNLSLSQFFGLDVSESNPDVMYGGTADCGTLKRSADGSWSRVYGGDGGGAVVRLTNEENVLATCGSDYLWFYLTSNGGDSWSPVYYYVRKFNSPVCNDNINEYYIYAGGEYNVLKSTNFGDSFSDFGASEGGAGYITAMAPSPSDDEVFAFSRFKTENPNNGTLVLTNDGGDNWTVIDDVSNNEFDVDFTYTPITDIEINPSDDDDLWICFGRFIDGEKVYKTSDFGSNWTNISYDLPNIPINNIEYDDINEVLYLGTDFGLFYLEDGTTNWYKITGLPDVSIWNMKIVKSTGELVLGTYGRGVWRADLQCLYDVQNSVEVTTNTTWDVRKKITGDLTVSNSSTLTIDNTLMLMDEATLTVESGSTLIITENGVIKGGCDGYFGGIIDIEPGGTMEIETNGQVLMGESGTIYIEYCSTIDKGLIINPDAIILLNDNDTKLEISGDLTINANATFTYTGNGFVKFSNPVSEPHNITAFTNSGFVLNGSTDQTDKILEVAQTSIYIPENIETFTLNDGLVHMSNNYARIVPEWSGTDITVTDVLFTPQSANRTDHRGLVLCGQQNTVISGCKFEKGQYGIYAYLTWNGNSLEINTSEFEDNDYGVWENGVSIMLSECTFVDNTTGFYAQATSLDDNSITDCSFTGSDYPVRYISCSGNLLMENTEVAGALTSAVEVNGSHTFTGICNEITDADNSTYAGLYATSNVIVYLDPTWDGESNYFADNYYHIKFSNANYIYLNNGLNMFYPNNEIDDYKFYGTLNKYACYIRYPNIFAYNNQWYSNPATSLSSSDYSIWKYGLCSEYYTINGTSPTEFEYCLQGFGMLAEEEESSINEEITNNLTASFQQNMNNVFETADTTGNWGDAHDYCWQVFQSPVPTASYSNIDYWDIAWVGLSHCTKKLYSTVNTTANNQTYLAHTFEALEKMKQLLSNNDARLFFLETEKAIFYRLSDDYSTALTVLDNLLSITNDSSELAYAERWRCIMQIEKDLRDGIINIANLQDFTPNCMQTEGLNAKSLTLNSGYITSNSDDISIKVIPNPVTSSSEIDVYMTERNSGTVEITDIYGRNLKSFKVTGSDKLNIYSKQFSKGIYTVKLISDGGKVKTTRMIIQ
ncbi:MAG: T9SS type A sorting domain-containing protein [Bacteroidota bacterium]